ncbi:peptidoglycan DD-metalloendopeptidase family protein [Kaistia dalseonensis]|uniref:Murein DD-endopeptidase MepM/ murein hydrolase activator NlpD n=1 Tax=Kaistia dalseonensis TaxID=410840 RepID=A0ABU0H1H4_9HYPH|nr:peptidoglycan DD-metalloendopeptidase family protein [Kaistia dalseonensis]MCX5493603.1 peptidoglycan DD-metalloendopeptidase family protein [Kaistia dalseonensis]MDQ0436164.1 murein DD-endopeptidase MepM/ murein hydrolase activator NlpD [Kaistia dalseonensis]
MRSRSLSQVAVIALLGGLTAACSADASRFGIPAFTGSTANQKQIIGGDQPMPQPVPYTPPTSVQRSDLPPPGGQSTLLPGVASSQPSQQPYNAQPIPGAVASAASSVPLTAPVVAASARPGGWETAGGTTITLAAGETLSTVSRRYGVPVKELAKANNIADPSAVTTGTRIVIPTYAVGGAQQQAQSATMKVAATANEVKAPADTPLNGLHTVAPGQTLSSIARLYNVSTKDLAAANNVSATYQVKSGQKMKIPGHAPGEAVALRPEPTRREETPAGEDPNKNPLASNTPAAPAQGNLAATPEGGPDKVASIAKPAADAEAAKPVAYAPPDPPSAAAAAADPGSANGTSFRWPVRGRIIGSFGSSPTGEKNDGINLAVPEGTSIKAVEAGTVIYAGNELEGYGNLVLIRHADGWVSAYAHNSQILVNRGDTVRRGQIISRAGTSGSVSAPQLHFELRKGSKPVNPLDYLQG